jgi:hypothetical protein
MKVKRLWVHFAGSERRYGIVVTHQTTASEVLTRLKVPDGFTLSPGMGARVYRWDEPVLSREITANTVIVSPPGNLDQQVNADSGRASASVSSAMGVRRGVRIHKDKKTVYAKKGAVSR